MIKKTNKKNNTEKPVTNSCSGKRPIGPSGDQSKEVVAKCNQPEEVIANCENLQETNLSQYDIEKHNEQYRVIEFVQLPQRNHDRFLFIDDDVYLLGASVKDMGAGMCAVTKMEVSPELILGLLK